MNEPIDSIFAEGLSLSFPSGDIPCLPGFTLALFAGESYKTQKQEFVFIVKTQDVIDYDIKLDDSFTFQSPNYLTSFTVGNTPIDDHGLSSFYGNFISRESL